MPNALAHLALIAFPVVVAVLFRRLPLPRALAWSIVAGYLLLPTRLGFNLPALPSYDRTLAPSLAAAIMTAVVVRSPQVRRALRAGAGHVAAPSPRADGGVRARMAAGEASGADAAAEARRPADPTVEAVRLAALRRRHPLLLGLLGLLALSPIATFLANGESVWRGGDLPPIPGLRPYDLGNMVLGALVPIVPFLLARRYLASPASHATLLRVLAVAGLLYSIPALVEIRLSPQINVWVYGFFPHSFAQHIREGGFRPVVFLEHGLRLGIFLAMALLAAAALWRGAGAAPPPSAAAVLRRGGGADRATVGRWGLALLWMGGTLYLSKNLGAFVIAAAVLPIMILAGARGRLLLAGLVALTVLLYPMLRGAGLVPTALVHDLAASANPSRAASLQFRFDNEDTMLARANLKPLAGWGGFGRSDMFDERTGEGLITPDGVWIITIATRGWLGYIAIFGLLTLPILLLWRRRAEVAPATAGLALVLTASLLDLLPNSGLTPVTWLLAGALAGQAELLRGGGAPTRAAADGRNERPATRARAGRPARAPARAPLSARVGRIRARRRA